jgi:proteic killer suppression protein
VIVSFSDPATDALYHGRRDRRQKRFPRDILRTAVRKLDMLAAAHQLKDLRVPPGNRLEALKGDRKGSHSIRINEQWRIVFRWTKAGAEEVEIVDYH